MGTYYPIQPNTPPTNLLHPESSVTLGYRKWPKVRFGIFRNRSLLSWFMLSCAWLRNKPVGELKPVQSRYKHCNMFFPFKQCWWSYYLGWCPWCGNDLINWLEEASLHPRPLSQSISKHLNPSQCIWMHLNASKPPHLPTHSISLPSASQSPSSPAGPWLRRPLPSFSPTCLSASTRPPECTAPLVTKASQHSQSSPASLTFSTFHQLLHKWSYQWEIT